MTPAAPRPALRAGLAALACAALAGCAALPFGREAAPDDKAAAASSRAQYRVEVEAPDELRKLLTDYLDLARFQNAPDTEAIDTTTAGGKLVFHIFGALAEFERAIIRERTRAGLEAAKARGRQGGRPPKLTPQDLAAARALLADASFTVAEVARRLGVSPATLYRHLPAARSQGMQQ